MRRSLSVFFALVFLMTVLSAHAAQVKPVNQPKQNHAVVEGQVITGDGMPVANATVYALRTGGSFRNVTDDYGKFTLPVLAANIGSRHTKKATAIPTSCGAFIVRRTEEKGFQSSTLKRIRLSAE